MLGGALLILLASLFLMPVILWFVFADRRFEWKVNRGLKKMDRDWAKVSRAIDADLANPSDESRKKVANLMWGHYRKFFDYKKAQELYSQWGLMRYGEPDGWR